MKSPILSVRVDAELKREAEASLAKMGLDVSTAVRMLLLRVAAEKRLPFEVVAPGVVARAEAYEDRRATAPG